MLFGIFATVVGYLLPPKFQLKHLSEEAAYIGLSEIFIPLQLFHCILYLL